MTPDQVSIYTPESSLVTPRKMLLAMLADLKGSQGLAWRLARRDISAQYRQSLLGILWAFILPLANTLAWLFLQGSGIVSFGATAVSYPVYVLTGTMLWGIFSDACTAPLHQVGAARPMLAKLNFPREALILSGVYQALFHALIKVGLLLAALLLLGVSPGWRLLLFPGAVLSLIVAGTALGLLVTPLGMLYNDVGRAVPLFMQFLMYVTPVVFPMPKGGWAAALLCLNPLTPLVMAGRDWVTGAGPGPVGAFLIVTGCFFLLLLAVWVLYRIAMPILIERMSA